jgi:mono/diheme cytochrome c family protein
MILQRIWLPVACIAALCTAGGAQAADGPSLFADKCQICHQAEGVGAPGSFPRLSGRVSAIAVSPAGRKFLSTLLLNGMSGTVTVDNQSIIGVMPGFDAMSDADLAKILTYVSHLAGGKAAEFKPRNVAAARAAGPRAPAEVASLRNKLAADKVIP